MRFYEEMRSKYGFSDGASVPFSAAVHRKVYVKVINQFAAQMGIEQRAYACNRGGLHNWCLLLFAPQFEINGLTADELYLGRNVEALSEISPNEAMLDVIELVGQMEIDRCLCEIVRRGSLLDAKGNIAGE